MLGLLLLACSSDGLPDGATVNGPPDPRTSGGAGAASGPSGPPPFALLFESAQLPSFYLTIPDDNGAGGPSSYQQLERCRREGLEADPPAPECDYQAATFHAEYDPDPLDGAEERVTSDEIPIGVRLKGRASFRSIDDKPALKIKFTELQGERFLGLSRLTLNNMVQDPSSLRERIAYRVYRDAGVPAPLANSARVYIRRNASASYDYYGLYANVQTLDRRFVEYRFGEVGGEAGNLYDTKNTHYFTDFDRSDRRDQAGTQPGEQEERFQLETNTSAPDTSDLTSAIDAIYVDDVDQSPGELMPRTSPVLDVEEWLRASAVQALIADWDGFAGARNNYKAYRDLVTGRFVILPWGADQTFGATEGSYRPNWHYDLRHESSDRTRPLFLLRCLRDDADCGGRYRAMLTEVAGSFDAQAVIEELDAAARQIEAAVLQDERRPHDDQEFARHVQYVRHFLENRSACVARWLDGQPCERLTCPDGDGPDCRE